MKKRSDLLQDIFATMDTQHRLMQGVFARHFTQFGLPLSQLKLLMTIGHDEKFSLKTIAEKLYLTPGAVTQLIEPLEQTGLVERQPDKQDRRVVFVSLTKAGKAKLSKIEKARQKFLEQGLESLSTSELRALVKIQQKMISKFTDQN